MGWTHYIFACVAVAAYARTLHARSHNDYGGRGSPYWVPSPPFSQPGHIFGRYGVGDLIPIAADFWHAESLVDAGRRTCSHLESDLSEYLTDLGLNPIVPEGVLFNRAISLETICDIFRVGNIEEICRDTWHGVVPKDRRPDLVEGSQSLIFDLRCRRRNFPDGLPTSLPRERPSLDTVTLRDFNIYDPCSVSGIEKLNNILFALMDWVGPKFFKSITEFGPEFFGLCEIGRYIVSMDVSDFRGNLTGILKYPAADILEVFQFFDICALSETDERGAKAIGAFKDLLVEFSDLDEAAFCEFIAHEQTRDSYLGLGQTIVASIFNLKYNEESCGNVLNIIAPFDEFGYFHLITGYDLADEAERREFCASLVEAYDPSSTYTPTPYEIPADGRVGAPYYNADPGVVLPGLTFFDLMRIDGAAGRGPKILDGIVVYCDAFEMLLDPYSNSMSRSGRVDFGELCDAIRARDLAEAERMCIRRNIQGRSRDYGKPLWLRPFDAAYEGIYWLHQLTGLMDLSKDEVCSAADALMNGVSVFHLFQQMFDIMLTELLPYADRICVNWDEAVCQWKPYCLVPGQPTPGYNRWYTPSDEEKERQNAAFGMYASILASLGATLTGFDTREETCAFIAEAIDPLSGRAIGAYAERAREQIMGVLTDIDRCTRVVDTALGFFPEGREHHMFQGADVASVIHQITGFDTPREFCRAVAESFAGPGGTSSPPSTPAGRLAATYNVIANIVVHVQRVARSL